jgi:Cof subfamily protein (haloacid dehalogenase superfamily)
MNKCLIIFDIDETLYLNKRKQIPESTLLAIDNLKKAGHTLGIATGRAPFEIFNAIKVLPFDFFIMANGQLVVHQGKNIYENPLDIEIIKDIVSFADESSIYLGFNSATRATVTGMNAMMKDAFHHYYESEPEVDPTIFNSEPIFQMWLFSEEYEAFAQRFKDKVRIVPWLDTGADIIPLDSSKATGLKSLIEANLGQLPEKIVFFGDGANDIELVEMADIGVAMGNAIDILKEKADFVTKHIEADGIYYACEQLGLFEKEELV